MTREEKQAYMREYQRTHKRTESEARRKYKLAWAKARRAREGEVRKREVAPAPLVIDDQALPWWARAPRMSYAPILVGRVPSAD